MDPNGHGDNPWRAAGMVGVMGLSVAVCIFIGYIIGDYAGSRFGGWQSWVIGGVLSGLAAGILSVVMLLRKVLGDTK